MVMPDFNDQILDPEMLEASRESAFLKEALGRSKQWGPGTRPSTREGEEFVLSYLEQFGTPPSPLQVADYKKGLGAGANLEFLPGTGMFKLGFRNREQWKAAQQAEEAFGPMLGENVPAGGLVLTRDGQPYLRTFNPQRYPGAIERGEFIQPPGGFAGLFGEQEGLFGEAQGLPETVPTYYGKRPQFEPTMEGALGTFAPVQVYQARITDYITEQKRLAEPILKDLSDQYDAEIEKLNELARTGEIGRDDFNRQVAVIDKTFSDALEESGAMTEAKEQALLNEVETGVAQGLSPEELPFFAESQGVEGAEVMGLFNQGVDIARKQFEEEFPEPPAYSPPSGDEPPIRTGTEERDYYAMVQSMGLAPEIEQYMMRRFGEYLGRWMQTGPSTPFLDWLRIEMGG